MDGLVLRGTRSQGNAAAEEDDAQAMAIPLRSGKRDEAPSLARAPRRGAPQDGEVLEPGRSLVLADFAPPSLGAGERLLRFAYRMGVPGSTLSSPFRKPARLRLLATVESPLAGDRVAGVALRAGHFLVHGVKAPIAQMDFAATARLTPPFERVIHGFSWLRDLAASAPREQCGSTAERLLLAWLDANPRPGKGAAWQVEHAGTRLLNWLVHAPLILSGIDRALRSSTLNTISETARWLDRNVARAVAVELARAEGVRASGPRISIVEG